VPPPASEPRLRVLYAGVDGLALSVLSEIRFVELTRTAAMRDGVIPRLMDTAADDRDQCDVLVVDELPGKAHTFECGQVGEVPRSGLAGDRADTAQRPQTSAAPRSTSAPTKS
jgi:hypothetical protein